MKQTAVVVDLGEVGRPLLELVERAGHTAVGVDIEPASIRRGCRGGHTTPSGHQVEVIPGANEYADPKIRLRTAAGAELTNATNVSGESVYPIALGDPYK
jgi:UDP-N-acetyl-D-mannosaminuronate dehydrogenase